MRKTRKTEKTPGTSDGVAVARCLCGTVQMELTYPAFWAWHDHSERTQRAQGCAYATYVGSWKNRFRIVSGAKDVCRFEDKETGATRSFCGTCGTPLTLERARAPKWINIPRALFETRTGREPRYHLHSQEAPEWAYRGEPLTPLRAIPA